MPGGKPRQAEQETPPSQTSPPECAKQAEGHSSNEDAAQPLVASTTADERQAQLRAITGDLMYWKGGLKVLKQARLPKWRGCFKWQIEEKVEALQAAHVRLRAEVAKESG